MKRRFIHTAILLTLCSLLFACSSSVEMPDVRQQEMVVGVSIALTETAPPVPTLTEPELAPPLILEPDLPTPTPVPAPEVEPDLPEPAATAAPPPTAVPPQLNRFTVTIDPPEPAQSVVVYALKLGGGEERAEYYSAESDAQSGVLFDLPPGGYVFFAYSLNYFQDNGYFGAWLPEGGLATFVSEGTTAQHVIMRRPADTCNPNNQILFGAPDSRFPPTAPGGVLPAQCQEYVEPPAPATSPVVVRIDPGQTPPDSVAVYAEIPGGGESDRFYFVVEGSGSEPLTLNLPPGGYLFYAYSTMFEDISYFAAWNPDGGLQMLGADSAAEIILRRPADPCNPAYQISWSSPDGRFPATNSEERLMRYGCS